MCHYNIARAFIENGVHFLKVLSYTFYLLRRGARADEWDCLENSCTLRGTVGSNPTLSDDNNPANWWDFLLSNVVALAQPKFVLLLG